MKKQIIVLSVLVLFLQHSNVLCQNILNFSQWATVSPAAGWVFASGDFTGDGKPDLAGYHPSNGTVWVGTNSGSSGFTFSQWATVSPAAGWVFTPGDYTGDGKPDLAGYHPSNGTVWVANTQLTGYCWPLSAKPGETIDFKISGIGSKEVVFYRHMADATGDRNIEMGRRIISPFHQNIPENAWQDGCNWATTFTLTIPTDWPSGIYSLKLDASSHISFVVNPSINNPAVLAL